MRSYRLAPGVRWAVERSAVKLTDAKGTVRTLRYPEAAVWDLLSRGYAFDKVVSMITHIAALDSPGANVLVRTSVEDWAQSGFIEMDKG